MSDPAQNIDAERALVGCALEAAWVLDEIDFDAADFYHPRHEFLWRAMVDIHARGERPDSATIAKELGAAEFERCGGALYVYQLTSTDVNPMPVHATTYARAVSDCALTRRLVEASVRIRQRAEIALDAREAAEDCRKIIEDVTTGAVTVETGMDAADLVTETIGILESTVDRGISTGWADLDHPVNGLRPGQLAIVGARPSVGKSVIAANLAASACKAGVGVHFASLEMTRTEVMQRLFAAHATVDLGLLVNSQLSDKEWDRLGPKAAEVQRWPLRVDDQPSQSLAQLRSRARSTSRRMPLGLIVVDYLQLMAPRSRQAPREQQVGEISEGLKGLAKELRVPIVALAQVNRGPSDRQDKRPMMSDLRESGRIEADADHIWLLHRQDLVDPKSTTGELEVIVAKNRNGVAGTTVVLQFQGHYSRAMQRAWSPSSAIA